MNLIYIAALIAVCSAAKLDRSYLPPASSKTAGGSSDLLTPHFRDSFEPGREGLPKGAEENEFEGVVVEAAAPGTRQSGSGESGLGGPRLSYGSAHSKVGEAAFRIKQQQRPDSNTNNIAGQNNFQTIQAFYPGASFDFQRPHTAADQSDSQVPHGIHQGAAFDLNRRRPVGGQFGSHGGHQETSSDYNRPRPAGEQSGYQVPYGVHQGASSDFNRPQPAVDQSDPQFPNGIHQGAPSDLNRPGQVGEQVGSQVPRGGDQNAPSDYNRPRPAGEQSGYQAPHGVHQGASSHLNRPQPAADQTDIQVSHGFQQETPSDFNRPRPAGEQSGSQVLHGFHQGTPSDFNRLRPAGDLSGSQASQSFHHGTPSNFIRQRPQSAFERTSNTVRIENNVGSQAYNYGYETENGITAEERGVSINGVQAQGGFSYTGDDGKFYKITYTAGEGGYQPVGDHLPTPPPIPDEILKSLEQNAKEEAGGPEDDGSYDAAKYNAEDDYTKSDSSNSRQPAFGKKPESEVDISGTFINQNNQNNRPFESFSNNNRQEPTSIHRFSEHHSSIANNFTSTQDGAESHDNKLTQNPDTTKFVPSQNEGDKTFMQFGLPDSERETNKQDDQFGPGDYSRPINFGSTQFNQFSGNGFGNKHHDLPSSNYFTQNQATGVQSDNIQTDSLSPIKPQGISGSLNFVMKNKNDINQQNANSQDGSQILPHSNKYTNNIESSINLNVPEKQLNSYPSIPSTLQPSLELSTPYEYSSFSDNNVNVENIQGQSQEGFPRPTQQSFSSQVTSDPQSSIVTNSGFITSNTDPNLQSHNSNSQQDSNHLQQLPFVEQQHFNIHSQNKPKQDQPYYYNQPSITFNPYVRPIHPTFIPIKSDNRFSNSFPTKYPSPPTVATLFSSTFPGRNMYNENSNIPQNNGFGATTKYPEPPSLGHIIPSPTSPTTQGGEIFFAQHTGLTQASVSPFPSISPLKHNSGYNYQPIETTRQNVSPNLESTKFQQETNVELETDSQVPNTTNLSTIGEKTRPNQQFDGEVYEYKKPTQTLITPTESDESIQQNGFPQFGQKLKPSISQPDSNFNQKIKQSENNKNQKYPSSQESVSFGGTTPLTELQNFRPQISLQATPESNNQGFNKDIRQPTGPTSNVHTTVHEQPTQSSHTSSGTFSEAQTTADYNGPFGFSSRIRPCCQGPRRIPTGKIPDLQTGNQNSVPFGHQNTNLRPEFEGAKPGSTQSAGIQNGLQNAQTTSQSLFMAKGEQFDGARQPPSFDIATGYHYK